MSEMITNRADSNTYYNYTDLNRVESKVEELSALLTEAGYMVTAEVKKDWTITDHPTTAQMRRYLDNVKRCAVQFYAEAGKNLPSGMRRLDYTGANEIEKVLVIIEGLITDMKAAYRRCNTFKCGE